MGDDITIGVTEIVNNIEVTAQPNDQIVDISVTDNADNVTLNITPTVVEVNINKGSSFAQWGDIYGTLSDQTDLQNALNLKANLVGGKVPASELPSYVDDIIEVANYAALPATGETGKIYVTLDNNKIYRWSGSVYIEIASNSAIWGAITGTLSSQTDLVNALNLRVPYTGATSNVNLGEYGLTSGFLGLDTTPTSTPTGIGTIYWDAANRTAALIDGDGDTTLQIGQEQRILVHNNTGSTLTDGQVVYVTGSTGNVPSVSLANASSETTSAATIGVVTESIAQGADGFITTSGIVNGLNTLAFNEGDLLWLGTTAGTFTTTKPISPNHLVLIGYVIKKAGGNGSILVKIQNTQELEESSDVLFTSLTNKDFLVYESATDLWKNKSLGTVLGGTSSQFVKGDGSLDSTTYLSGTVAIANGGTGATTADAALTNLGGTTVGKNIFTSTNPSPITTAYLKVKPDNSVEWLEANAFRIAIGAGTGNGTVTSVEAVGGYGGLTLTGTVTGSGQLTLGGTPEGNWPINITGNASSVNTVLASTNADFYLTFVDSGNGSPQSDFLYTVGSVKVNPSTGALTAGSFVKSGGTSSQYLMADGSVSTGSGGTVTGTGTTNYIPKFTGASAIGNSLIYDNGTNVGIGTTSPDGTLTVAKSSPSSYVISSIRNLNSGVAGGVQGSQLNFYGDVGYPVNAPTSYIQSTSNDGGSSGQGSLRFGNYNGSTSVECMRITSGGNVGIGTSSPSARLHLVSAVGASGATLPSNASVIFDQSGNNVLSIGGGTTDEAGFWFARGTSAYYSGVFRANDALLFRNNDTERMRITSGGNLLLGTTTDIGQRLQVSGGYITQVDGGVRTFLGYDGSGSLIGTTTNNYFRFITNDTERMRITSGGNVGIGTTSPGSKLTVDGGSIRLLSGNDLAFNRPDNGAASNILMNSSNVLVFTSPSGASFSGSVTATGFFNSSDNRLKDLTDYDYNVSDIKPITYLWKDGRDNKKHVGYSAQEVQKVMPDAVNEDDKGFLSVNYVEILVAKISQMEKEIAYLKSKI